MATPSASRASSELAARRTTALVSPLFDGLTLAWAWLPFYAFVVFGLGLDGDWSPGGRDGNGTEPGLGLAMLAALGISYIHRHYTFLLVYGDGETFQRHRRAFTLAPALIFVALALVLRLGAELPFEIAGLKLRPWMIVLVITGIWNLWHTIMQRYGIARIYAAKAGAGLESRPHSRRDLALTWAAVALTAVLTLRFRASTFAGIGNARKLLTTIEPVVHGTLGWIVLTVVASVFVQVAYGWLVHERAAELSMRERIPRLNFLASTAGLLAVFLVHGPIIGYLCFGVAHALEYVVFFHVFGHRRFIAQPKAQRGVAAKLLARPWLSGPAIALLLTALFFALVDHRRTDAYMAYYTATSLLHFLYDGWIWKRPKKPERDVVRA